MRFSIWPNPAQDFATVRHLGEHAAANGWDGLWLADHFMPNARDVSTPWPEAWTTLAALAAVIPRIRLGTLVTGNTYRHPAVLAKMAATVDHISGGRTILGLGSGWQENEHRAYGIEFSTVGGRLARLDEACRVIRGLFENPRFSFDGKFYQIEEAPLEPKPIQNPLPLMIGGGGEQVTLRITARHADEWNVWGDVDTLVHKMAVLDRHCDTESRDPQTIQRSAVALMFLSDDPAFVKRQRAEGAGRPQIVGNVEQVRETVAAYAEAGVDELVVPDWTMPAGNNKLDILERLIREVAPVARQAGGAGSNNTR